MHETTTATSIWEKPGPDGGPSLEELDRQITELAAHIDAATHRLLTLIAELDRRKGWAAGGFLSCAHYLGVRIGLGEVAAREKVRVARALESLPGISQAMARGELSYSKVRAITRIATADNEQDLLAMARGAPASHLERVVREYRRAGRLELDRAQRQREGRFLNACYDDSGMLVIEGRLPPEVGAVLLEALDGAKRTLRDSAETPAKRDTSVSPAKLRADALGLLAERALPTLGTAERGEPYQVLVHVDAEVLADPRAEGECCIEHGPALSGQTARRISCDAPVVTLVQDGKETPLSVGRKTRRVSRAIYRALRARDRTCTFPGCTRTAHLEVHHVKHWADGGATELDNLGLLCGAHHAAVHEGGVTIERTHGGLVFRTPAGYPIAGGPPPTLPEDPVAALVSRHAAEGLDIGPGTNAISWWGEPLDAHWAVTTLKLKDRCSKQDVEESTAA